MNPALRSFALGYQAIFAAMLCPLFYIFFAVFPARSPLDRRIPWLKWVGVVFGVMMAVTAAVLGDPREPGVTTDMFGERVGENVRLSLIYMDYFFIAAFPG